MRPTRLRTLLVVALVAGVLTWSGLSVWTAYGNLMPAVPWLTVLVTFMVAAAVLAAGWPVRRWVRGKRDRPLDVLVAARTVVLAKASAYTGSALVGWYGAQVLLLVSGHVTESRREQALVAAASVLGSLAMAGAGLLVEWFCRVPPSDDDDSGDVTPA